MADSVNGAPWHGRDRAFLGQLGSSEMIGSHLSLVNCARRDIAKVQYSWPVGLPLCRPLSGGLWEVRASLPSKREARIFFGFHDGLLVAVHAIIKKTQKTPAEDLALARQRFRELQSWQGKTRT